MTELRHDRLFPSPESPNQWFGGNKINIWICFIAVVSTEALHLYRGIQDNQGECERNVLEFIFTYIFNTEFFTFIRAWVQGYSYVKINTDAQLPMGLLLSGDKTKYTWPTEQHNSPTQCTVIYRSWSLNCLCLTLIENIDHHVLLSPEKFKSLSSFYCIIIK